MSFDKLAKKYNIKAVYRVFKGDKIVLGILSEEKDVDLSEIARSFGADEAILIDLEKPETRYPILSGTLLVSLDDEYRKEVEITILEKNTEMKLQKLNDDVISELL